MVGCERERGVYAGNDSDVYQPRPALKKNQGDAAVKDIKGELLRVDIPGRTIAVRVENGMEPTFEFHDNTIVTFLEDHVAPPPSKTGNISSSALRNLDGKEGSEVTIKWNDDNGAKMATNVEVTQVITAKNMRRVRRHR